MKRRGRKRKLGKRHPGGKLILAIRESPAQRAAKMPHRRGLQDEAVNPLAESELGRLQLRGELDPIQVAAGQEYARLYRLYMQTIGGPRRPNATGHGRMLDCGGCLGMVETQMCICWRRRRAYEEADYALTAAGSSERYAVIVVTLQDLPCLWVRALGIGLWALARYFGLTKKPNQRIGKMHRPKLIEAPPAET